MLSMLTSMMVGGDDFRSNVAEIIPGRLDFICMTGLSPPSGPAVKNAVLFSVDRVLNYEPFFVDFGPLNLGQLYRFFQIIEEKLQNPDLAGRKLIMYTAKGPQKKANSGYLIASYMVLLLNMTPEQAWSKISHITPVFLPFRDASMQVCTYKHTILHCLQALESASRFGWVNLQTFDVEQYERLERIENGDLNVIVPGKFVHFSGPSNGHRADGYPSTTPDDYIKSFQDLGVTDIIRLNKRRYDKTRFTKHGFQHHDMYFVDGTTPSMAILEKFMSVCDQAKGMVAVHCKAGLGRTGTCVGCYLMKYHRITAAEAIAWLRICRPGSVLGPQQHFLENMQIIMWQENDKLRKRGSLIVDKKAVLSYNLENHLQNVQMFETDFEEQDSVAAISDGTIDESQGDQLNQRKFEAQFRKSETDIDLKDDEEAFDNQPKSAVHPVL